MLGKKEKMDQFKERMKTIIKLKVIEQSRDGRDCLGCIDDTLAHTCESSMTEKIVREFDRAYFNYFANNVNKVQNTLRMAILIELLSDEMPRSQALLKAADLSPHNHITYGGGSSHVTSSTDENQ